jgi:thiazole synthase ThiGH ThiG subunit
MILSRKARLAAKALPLAIGACLILGTSTAQAQQAKRTASAFEMVISNTACFSGEGLQPYLQQATVMRENANRARTPREGAPQRVAVSARAWRGLTVTGVGLYYSQTAVFFAEPLPVVRRVLRRNGVRVLPNGSIPMNTEEAVEVQSLSATRGAGRAYGASEVVCGT